MEFTQIQKDILHELISGSTNAQIAELIGYSERNTIRKIKELYRIYKVNNRYSLIREAAIAKIRGFI